jgi:hypothetical protein
MGRINKTAQLCTLTLCFTTIVNSFADVSAQSDYLIDKYQILSQSINETPSSIENEFSANLPAGTIIPTNYPEAQKILVTKEETAPITLEVTEDIKDTSGNIVIPRGSLIAGEIRPADGGSYFVSEVLLLANGDEYAINADSQIISRTENIDDGRNTDAIWQGAVAGSAAASIIASFLGDNAIATEEVLGGAGFGALMGFLLGGNRTKELISIDTEEDLDLILTDDFSF